MAPSSSKANLRLVAILSVLGGLALLGLSARKTVTVVVGSQTQKLQTFALTVGGLLRAVGLQLHTGDEAIPQLSHWLRDGDRVTIQRAAQIWIQTGEKTVLLVSTERRPANLFQQLGVPLFPEDVIIADGLPVAPEELLPLRPVHSLQLLRASPITFSINSAGSTGDRKVVLVSSATTLGKALWEGGFKLYDQDRVEPGLEQSLRSPQQVTLDPSQAVSIRYKDKQLSIRTSAATVGAALAEAGLPLEVSDYSNPGPASSLPGSGEIRIVRVQDSLVLEQKPIPFESQYQPDPEMDMDSQVVIQPGAPGIETRRIRVRYENGQEASRRVEAEFVSQPPQTQIIGVGTKISLKTLNIPGGQVKYWHSMTVYATSYSPCRIFKDHCDSGTASGATLQKGIAAVTGEWYRYLGGTRVYVPGYGIATIADVGGGIPGQAWIDLGYSDNDYVSWHQTVTMYFLAPAPPEIPWILK